MFFLKHNAKCKWVVENVKPYYDYLIKPSFILQRHPFWSNFKVEEIKFETDKIRTAQIPDLQKLHGIDLSEYKIKDKRKLLRNCVHKDLGKHIIKESLK